MTIGPNNKDDERTFIAITPRDVWLKLLELEKKVDRLSIKVYAAASAGGIIIAVLGLTGRIQFGGG